jgi:hypothetical protein
VQSFGSIFSCLAELGDTLEFPPKKVSFHIKRTVIKKSSKVWWLNNEVMDDSAFFTG